MLGVRPEVYFGRKPKMMTYISFPKVTSEDYEDDVYSDMTSMVPKIGVPGSKCSKSSKNRRSWQI